MTNEYQVRVLPEVAAQQELLKAFLAEEYGFRQEEVMGLRILKRSIDARQRTIYINIKVRVYINELPSDDEYVHTDYPDVSHQPQVVVVGAGPGGLFAALRLIEHGLRPIVIERGKDVHERKKDLAQIARTQWRRRCRCLLGWKALYAQQEARQRRQDSERVLSAWGFDRHPGRCPSAHWHRPIAKGH